MNAPHTHYFIGPLTEAQQNRRRYNRHRWNDIAEIMDARDMSFKEATKILSWQREHRWAPCFPERYPQETWADV